MNFPQFRENFRNFLHMQTLFGPWEKTWCWVSPLKGFIPRATLCIMASLTSLLRTHWMPRFWKLGKNNKQSVKLCSLILNTQICLVKCIVHLELWSQRLKLTGRVRLELTKLTYYLKLRADWSSKGSHFHTGGIPCMAPSSKTTCFFKKKEEEEWTALRKRNVVVCGLE